MFEVLKCDMAGRIGVLHTAHGRVETPAYVPVVHPVRRTVDPAELRRMGFGMVITNAYIARERYGREAERRGIHAVVGFDGAVMTDSGGYQVLEYGDVDVTPDEMARFESAIGSDVAIPLDRPTGLGLSRAQAARMVDHTLEVSANTLRDAGGGPQIWAGPVQGGEHLGLVRRSARALLAAGFEMLALGSPVELMESYRYATLAGMIAAARRQMPPSAPLHLFGAGHPLTIPLAVALGCDTFDSASYVLYARHGRYITEDGTRHLGGMRLFSCLCRVCSGHTPAELAALPPAEREAGLAVHNLHAIRAEVDRVREAIHEGRLWEHVMMKMRAHPGLHGAAAVVVENRAMFEEPAPRFKKRAIFLFSEVDQHRPEVLAYHRMARAFSSKKAAVCVTPETQRRPAYLSPEYRELRGRFADPGSVQFCQYSPFLGLVPVEISDVFPAAHCVAAGPGPGPAEATEFAATWDAFFRRNRFAELHFDRGDAFLRHFARRLPASVRRRHLGPGKNKKKGKDAA